jgi:hypothetical protein
METSLLRTTLLTDAIRRDILAVLAESDTTVAAATAQIAAGWGARRRRRGDSPSSVHTAEAIAFQVGADLADDVTQQPAACPPGRGPSRWGRSASGTPDRGATRTTRSSWPAARPLTSLSEGSMSLSRKEA